MMKGSVIIVAIVLLSFDRTLAQEDNSGDSLTQVISDTTYWTSEFSAGLNFNQAAFSGNWKSGGINSVAFSSVVTGRANYAQDRFTWDNQMELLFGVVNNQGQGSRKSTDRIFLDSKVGYK